MKVEIDLFNMANIHSRYLGTRHIQVTFFAWWGFRPGLYLWVSLKLGRRMFGTVEGMSFRGPARQYDRQLSAPYEMYFGVYIKVTHPSINCPGGKWTNESN